MALGSWAAGWEACALKGWQQGKAHRWALLVCALPWKRRVDGTVGVAAAADLAAGEWAETGWQDCPGVLITLSKGDSGHRSNLKFLFSSIVYLLPMSFKLNAPKLFFLKNIRLNE